MVPSRPSAAAKDAIALLLALASLGDHSHSDLVSRCSSRHCVCGCCSGIQSYPVSDSWRPHGLQHARPPCPSLCPRVCSGSCPLTMLLCLHSSLEQGRGKGAKLSSVRARARMRAESCLTLRPLGLYVAHEAPLSTAFPRQEYWSGLPYPRGFSPPRSQTLLRGFRRFFTSAPPTGAVLHFVSLNLPCLAEICFVWLLQF